MGRQPEPLFVMPDCLSSMPACRHQPCEVALVGRDGQGSAPSLSVPTARPWGANCCNRAARASCAGRLKRAIIRNGQSPAPYRGCRPGRAVRPLAIGGFAIMTPFRPRRPRALRYRLGLKIFNLARGVRLPRRAISHLFSSRTFQTHSFRCSVTPSVQRYGPDKGGSNDMQWRNSLCITYRLQF